VAFGIACAALGFAGAWFMRSHQVSHLKREGATARADATLAESTSDDWMARAQSAEKELAQLPKRAPGGQFGKRK